MPSLSLPPYLPPTGSFSTSPTLLRSLPPFPPLLHPWLFRTPLTWAPMAAVMQSRGCCASAACKLDRSKSNGKPTRMLMARCCRWHNLSTGLHHPSDFSAAPYDLLSAAGGAFVLVPLALGQTLSSHRHGVGGRGQFPAISIPGHSFHPIQTAALCPLSLSTLRFKDGRPTPCCAFVGQVLIVPKSIVCIRH